MRKSTKKALSIILAIMMIATMTSFAFAAESDGERTVLSIADGKVLLTADSVSVGDSAVETDPDGYVITGQKSGDTLIEFHNYSDETVTFDVIFRNIRNNASSWCTALRIKGNSPIVLNIFVEGDNYFSTDNHDLFSNQGSSTVAVNLTFVEGSALRINRNDGSENKYFSGSTTLTANGNPVTANGSHEQHLKTDESVITCNGYKCLLCGTYFENGDELPTHEGGTQTCKGYKCGICGEWYGEVGGHAGGIQTCNGYKCETCGEWYGEAGSEHIDEIKDYLCDACDSFLGYEIKVGETLEDVILPSIESSGVIKFVPVVSGTYILSSDCEDIVYCDLYDENFESIIYSYDKTVLYYEYDFEAGKTYYFAPCYATDGTFYDITLSCKDIRVMNRLA